MLALRLLAVLTLLILVACAAERERPPNLLLVTVDTLRADRLACYGGPPDVGVGICALGERGTRFAWAFATAPVTVPSIASLLTSRYASFHGVAQSAGSALGAIDLSVAEVLRDSGYNTAAIVSNPALDYRNFRQGFDVYDAETTRSERNRPALERDAEATTDRALAWARDKAHEPWFLWVHFQDPHGPYEPPGAPPARDPPGTRRLPLLEEQSGMGGIPAYQALPQLFSLEAYEERYLEEIRYLDPHLRRLVDGVDAIGSPPAVLFTADHGEAFGEDGFYFAHGHSVGLDQIRVPLLWRPSGGGPALVVTTPVSLLDVAPTLTRAAGIPVSKGYQGQPLPVEGSPPGSQAERRAIFAEQRERFAVVRGDSYYSRDILDRLPKSWHRVRSAHLDGDGALPQYAYPGPGEIPVELEQLLRQFQRTVARRRAGVRVEVSEETRDLMRALGYVE